MLDSKTYDILKVITLQILPALTTFYGVLGATLNIPYTQEVITIAVAFDTMLGTILGHWAGGIPAVQSTDTDLVSQYDHRNWQQCICRMRRLDGSSASG